MLRYLIDAAAFVLFGTPATGIILVAPLMSAYIRKLGQNRLLYCEYLHLDTEATSKCNHSLIIHKLLIGRLTPPLLYYFIRLNGNK